MFFSLWNLKKMLVKIINREDPDQSASLEAAWLLSGTVCLGLFGRQLVFEILEHLP